MCDDDPDGEDEDGDGNDWGRGRPKGGGDLWDDVGEAGGDGGPSSPSRRGGGGGGGGGANLDLADFAAAALKFRLDTRGQGLADMGLDDGGPRRGNDEDALARLFREQTVAERLQKSSGAEGGDEDENEPEWADADVNEPMDVSVPPSSGAADSGRLASTGNETKRNLLFEVRVDALRPSADVCPSTHNAFLFPFSLFPDFEH